MSVVDWVCKKISLESASERLSAITISRQQVLSIKLDACANVTTCCSPRLALGTEKPQLFHRKCHGRFLSSFWRNHGFFSLVNSSWKSPVTRTTPISRSKRDGKRSRVTAPIDLSDFDKSINVFFPRRWIRLQFFLFLFLISSLIWHCFLKSLLR